MNFAFFLELLLLFCMLLGLLGLIVPVFPGLTVIWVLVLLYGIVAGFEGAGVWLFAGISILTIVGSLVDNLLMGGNALQKGASWLSLAAASVAGLLGSIFLTPIGGIALALLGLFLAEYARRKDQEEAWAVTKAMAIGWGWAFVARFGIGFVMIALWAVWAWA